MRDAFFGHALLQLPGLDPDKLLRLRRRFSSYQEIWQADARLLRQKEVTPETTALLTARRLFRPDEAAEQLTAGGIGLLSTDEPDYPHNLAHIPDPPLLYTRGNCQLLREPHLLAVVGSRQHTAYGEQATFQLISGLDQRFVIVSGLALGIDALAHQAALAAGLPTIAVLGGGIDDPAIFPRNNYALAQKILANEGLIITEHRPGMRPRRHDFPRRNRIIAGLSRGVVVVEAAARSGALITALLGLEYNREVMAVPGTIFQPSSEGANMLLTRGAHLVRNGQDIANALQLIAITQKRQLTALSPAEHKIMKIVADHTASFDEMVLASGLSAAEVTAIITTLELKQYIHQPRPGFFAQK